MKKAAGWIVLAVGSLCLVFFAGLFIGRNTASTPISADAKQPVAAVSNRTPSNQRININTADADALQSLPGIGEVLAQRIIAYRTEQGPFQTEHDLQKVEGIGPNKMLEIIDLITVEDEP